MPCRGEGSEVRLAGDHRKSTGTQITTGYSQRLQYKTCACVCVSICDTLTGHSIRYSELAVVCLIKQPVRVDFKVDVSPYVSP